MGTSGTWSADMSISRKVNVKTKKENSAEDIKKFIEEHKNMYKSKDSEEITKDDILLSVTMYDEDEEELETIWLKDIGLENVNPKSFIDDKVYSKHSEFEVDEYCETDPSYWMFNVKIDKLEEKLKFMDLELLHKYSCEWNPDEPDTVSDLQYLGSCSDDIYYENDNSGSDFFTITQEFIDGLTPGDTLIVTGTGDVY